MYKRQFPIRKPEQIVDILKEKGLPLPTKLMLEGDELPYTEYVRLAGLFPDAEVVNGTPLIRQARSVKTAIEIEMFRRCLLYTSLSTGKRSVNPRHQNNTELLLTIHLDYHRLFKADMTQEFRFFHRRLGVEEILIVDSVIHKGIDRKIAYAERSEVLEEVSSLTRVYTIIGQSGLHYHCLLYTSTIGKEETAIIYKEYRWPDSNHKFVQNQSFCYKINRNYHLKTTIYNFYSYICSQMITY